MKIVMKTSSRIKLWSLLNEASPTHGLEELNRNEIYEKDYDTSKLFPTSSSNVDEAAFIAFA